MSDDEVSVGVLAALFAAAFWGRGLYAARHADPLARSGRGRAIAGVVLLAALGLVAAALVTGADPQVRSNPGYIVLFLAVAADALAVATLAGSAFGLSALDGFVRGPNAAAGWAIAGLWLGTGLVNAGANIGRGDTIDTTLGPLALALATLLLLVGVLGAATGRFRAVRLDRDPPAGVRLAGLFVAWGLVLGRAVAGDWESARRTWEDFLAYGWPVLVLLAVAVPVEWTLRPTVRRPRHPRPAGVGPAVGYLAAAVGWVVSL
jgi:hypothetical protein